jgi:hypothetical protein
VSGGTQGSIRDIRVIRGLQKFPNFSRKESKNFTQYLSEWPEMIFSQREVTEGQNKKRKLERRMIMKTKLVKRITSYLLFACALVSLVAAMALGTPATAGPAPDEQVCSVCSVDMLKGLYIWTWDGYADLGGGLLPKAVMEGLRFNGDGTTINTFGTLNIGGTIIIDTTGGVGTYTVAADCTGTLSKTDGPSFNMYVGPGANKLWITQIAGGVTGLGVGTATRLPGR